MSPSLKLKDMPGPKQVTYLKMGRGDDERNGSPQEIGEEIKKKTAIQGIMIGLVPSLREKGFWDQGLHG